MKIVIQLEYDWDAEDLGPMDGADEHLAREVNYALEQSGIAIPERIKVIVVLSERG